MKKLTKEQKEGNARLRQHQAAVKYKLLNGSPVDHLREMHRMEDVLRTYYYSASKLKKAIVDHIARSKDCVLIDVEGTIICHRGAGASIRLTETDFRTYQQGEFISLVMEVEYFYEGQENSYDPDTYREEYSILVPADLEENFTKAKFKKFIEEKRLERDNEVTEKDLAELARLKKKYEETPCK